MSQDGYNVITALNKFKACIREDEVTIDLPKFVIAYREFVK